MSLFPFKAFFEPGIPIGIFTETYYKVEKKPSPYTVDVHIEVLSPKRVRFNTSGLTPGMHATYTIQSSAEVDMPPETLQVLIERQIRHVAMLRRQKQLEEAEESAIQTIISEIRTKEGLTNE